MKARIKITLKTGVLDPQGKAIQNALGSLGFAGVDEGRQGKYIEVGLKETDAAKSAVIPGFRTTITFKDANSQRIADLKLVTNEYGSYKGSFRIPEGGMNGMPGGT